MLGTMSLLPIVYQPKLCGKYVPHMHVDLGQGLLQHSDEMLNLLPEDHFYQ